MREINVSRPGDPVHAGDKALTRETPVQRGRVNRYANRSSVVSAAGYKPQGLGFESHWSQRYFFTSIFFFNIIPQKAMPPFF